MGDLFYAWRDAGRRLQRKRPRLPGAFLVSPASAVLGVMDVSALPILLPIDLAFLGCGQVSAVEFPVGADFLIDGGFILLKTGCLAGTELAGGDAGRDSVLLILAPRIHFVVPV